MELILECILIATMLVGCSLVVYGIVQDVRQYLRRRIVAQMMRRLTF